MKRLHMLKEMSLAGPKISKIQVIIMAVLLIGIIVAVFLVQRQQIFKGRATDNIYDAFDISPGTGGGNVTQTGPNTYSTDTLNINIKLQDLNVVLGD